MRCNNVRGWWLLAALLAGCGGGGSSSPTARSLSIVDEDGGDVVVGDHLRASYVYRDPTGTAEGASIIRWLRDSAPIAENVSSYTVTTQDVGHPISYEVTPVNQAGSVSSSAYSSPPVIAIPFEGTRLTLAAVASAYTNSDYEVHIYLPPGYSDTNRDYPVLYGTDAERRFAMTADLLDSGAREVIFVAVNSLGKVTRELNFTLPGAYDYMNFLTLELIPLIESQYRIDPSQRTLIGHSLGGLFAILAMYLDDPVNRLFSSFIVSDPSVWNQPELTIALDQELYDSRLPVPVQLFMASATDGNMHAVNDFYRWLLQRDYAQLAIVYGVYTTTHDELFPLMFNDSIEMLYP